jgi:hypothetical protein
MRTVAFNFDGSLPAQTQFWSKIEERFDCLSAASSLRLWAAQSGVRWFQDLLAKLRQQFPEPWITFLGSGDFHHLSLLILEKLNLSAPCALLVIDNHPDWFLERPRYHCGNWVAGAVGLPFVSSVFLLGQDSNDLKGIDLWSIPFEELLSGRLRLYPYRKSKIFVPGKWPSHFINQHKRHILGTSLSFETISQSTAEEFFRQIGKSLKNIPVYISIDKDCIRSAELETDWESGQFSCLELLEGLKALLTEIKVIGIDVCGERSLHPLEGAFKRIDARRWRVPQAPSPEVVAVHEKFNLELLTLFSEYAKPHEQ